MEAKGKERTQAMLEEGKELQLDFHKLQSMSSIQTEVLPVIVQHAATKEVLLLAYTNEKAMRQSLLEKRAVFWSTSRNRLWVKGESSGDYLKLVDVCVNCEQNSLLYLVLPQTGGVCHTQDANNKRRRTCFYRRLAEEGLQFLP